MIMELLELPAEEFHDQAKALEPPVMAFLVFQDENPDVICFYPLEKAV